jgi:uncharacterized protein
MIVVIDTNVFVSAVMSKNGASRQIIRLCLRRELTPLMGNALFAEFEDVCSRDSLFDSKMITKSDRNVLLDAFLASCCWVPIYFLWRPNLQDEADNHVLELAVAGNASCIVTANRRDFMKSDLKFPGISILSPAEFLDKGDFVS